MFDKVVQWLRRDAVVKLHSSPAQGASFRL